MNDKKPDLAGSGIGQSRNLILLLRKAHLGGFSDSVRAKVLKGMYGRKNIHIMH
jgi:asparagine synthetase A